MAVIDKCQHSSPERVEVLALDKKGLTIMSTTNYTTSERIQRYLDRLEQLDIEQQEEHVLALASILQSAIAAKAKNNGKCARKSAFQHRQRLPS